MIIYLLLALSILGGTQSFLPTRLNFNDPDFIDIFCPSQMTSPSINLKAISREGIRREIRDLFNEDPPSNAPPGFNVPDSASLSEMFHMYYGSTSSPKRFYSAVNTVAWANADVDSMESTKYDTKYHFDAETFDEGQALLAQRHSSIVASLMYNESYDFARQQIGFSLHAIQDFYSHSNWIELGNNMIIDDLGLPGFVISNVAGPLDFVCESCASPDGTCTSNIITSSGLLTSGYYEYSIPGSESFVVEKPAGKCSHGGTLDTSRTTIPLGGINKASSSPCFSPHFYHHDEVAELAYQATQRYLNHIRLAIGNERFRFLFDLYQGSALVIVIDTTGSMSNEIATVQEQVALIVETAPAELYILVPYNDPGFGPALRTTSSDEFLAAVNALVASGGGGVLEEMVWSALQLALLETPDYSTLYLFTDAGGYDYELMDGDISLAQQKNIICTTIFSYNNGLFTGPPYTNDTHYMNLATITGGEFIVIDEFTIDDVVPMIGDGSASSVVSLAIRRDMTGLIQVPALVDDTVTSLQVVISGNVITAFVLSPSGTNYNLMDEASLAGMATVNAFSDNIKDISFDDPDIGLWSIDTDSAAVYSVQANAQSPLGYLMEFTEIDSRPPRPNYRLINGQPIAGLTYYIENVLVGWIENEVDVVNSMVLLNDQGVELSNVINTEPVDDEFYIESEALPEARFYVGLNGQLKNGNGFVRLYETLITPAKVSVGIDLAVSNLSGTPGSTLTAVFNVKNNGPDAHYDYFVTDDKGYVTDFTPENSTIVSGATETVTVTVFIPLDAVAWTQSTIIFTASSRLISYDMNSDYAYVMVLPEESDTMPPVCTKNTQSDCNAYQSSSNCDEGTWMATAVITDNGELISIYTQPSNNDTHLEVDEYNQSGSSDAVNVTLTASCCITNLQIVGVDTHGNTGTCDYFLGDIDGILTFQVIEEGPTWIITEWTVSSVRPDLEWYTHVVDGLFSSDIRCFGATCTTNSTYLDPCSLHTFTLTPEYKNATTGEYYPGSTSDTSGETTDIVPNPPSNGAVSLSGNDVTISWDAPADPSCIVYYEVCYSNTYNTTCATSTETSLVVDDYFYCNNYTVDITSITKTGLRSSPPLTVNTTAVDGIPGEPTNFHMVSITSDTAHLTWDKPLTNASCAIHYTVNWRVAAIPIEYELSAPLEDTGEFQAIVSPLTPCVRYRFSVWANSEEGTRGPEAWLFDDAGEVAPLMPTNVTVTPTGFFSLSVTWVPGGSLCIDHYIICWQERNSLIEICANTTATNYDISELISCSEYAVTVVSVSPLGNTSAEATDTARTEDEVPGAPNDLTVTDVTNSTVSIGFNETLVNPQCVAEYLFDIVDLNSTSLFAEIEDLFSKDGRAVYDKNAVFNDLPSCTYFSIEVYAVSPHGLEGPPAITTTTTLEDIPSEPVGLNAPSATTTTIDVSWSEPMENPRCADYYEIEWLSAGGKSGREYVYRSPPGQFSFSHTIPGLDPCEDYNILVSGKTDGGLNGLVDSIPSKFTLC